MDAAPTPLLTLGELPVGRRFGPHPVVVGAAELAAYAAVTGTSTKAGTEAGTVPEGMTGMLARRAYLVEHAMPPGGVMLGQDLYFRRPVPAGVALQLWAVVEHVGTRKGRPYVEIRSVVGDGGTVCAEVLTRAQWPGEAP